MECVESFSYFSILHMKFGNSAPEISKRLTLAESAFGYLRKNKWDSKLGYVCFTPMCSLILFALNNND